MSNVANGVLSQAQTWLAEKVPYVSGGVTQLGADCSGFIQTIFANEGVTLPRISEDQATVGQTVPLADIQPGDVVFYNVPGEIENGSPYNNHEALYIGNGETIQETTPATGIQEEPLNSEPISVVKSFLDGSVATGTPSGTTGSTGSLPAQLTSFVQSSGLSSGDAETAHQMFLVIVLSIAFIYGLVEVAGINDSLGTSALLIIVGLFTLMGYQYYTRGSTFLSNVFGSQQGPTTTGSTGVTTTLV